jgi:hypothetical protein
MTSRPAGWFRDPDDDSGHRYWNGEEWTSTPEPDAADD